MKKLLLLSAILAGGVAATQAGINFNVGIGVRVPAPPVAFSMAVPGCAAPVVTASQVCEQPAYQAQAACEQPVVVRPQVCETPVYVQPRPVLMERERYGYRGHGMNRHVEYRRHDVRYYGTPVVRRECR